MLHRMDPTFSDSLTALGPAASATAKAALVVAVVGFARNVLVRQPKDAVVNGRLTSFPPVLFLEGKGAVFAATVVATVLVLGWLQLQAGALHLRALLVEVPAVVVVAFGGVAVAQRLRDRGAAEPADAEPRPLEMPSVAEIRRLMDDSAHQPMASRTTVEVDGTKLDLPGGISLEPVEGSTAAAMAVDRAHLLAMKWTEVGGSWFSPSDDASRWSFSMAVEEQRRREQVEESCRLGVIRRDPPSAPSASDR